MSPGTDSARGAAAATRGSPSAKTRKRRFQPRNRLDFSRPLARTSVRAPAESIANSAVVRQIVEAMRDNLARAKSGGVQSPEAPPTTLPSVARSSAAPSTPAMPNEPLVSGPEAPHASTLTRPRRPSSPKRPRAALPPEYVDKHIAEEQWDLAPARFLKAIRATGCAIIKVRNGAYAVTVDDFESKVLPSLRLPGSSRPSSSHPARASTEAAPQSRDLQAEARAAIAEEISSGRLHVLRGGRA